MVAMCVPVVANGCQARRCGGGPRWLQVLIDLHHFLLDVVLRRLHLTQTYR